MNKRTLILILAVLPLILSAKTLTKSELKTLGVRAFQQKAQYICPQATHYNLKQCEFIEDGGTLEMAVLHFDAGFLIMSAEDAVRPVLAYDFEHSLDLADLAPGLETLLAIYQQEIAAARRVQLSQSEKVKAEWEALRQPSLRGAKSTVVVAPLLRSAWNQDAYYNALCPQDENAPGGYDGRVPNGCVAVAMSQIIYYYRYPESGAGSHTNYTEYGAFHVNFAQQHYHYEAMCDELSYYNTEVAKLIFHCGTAVNMMYQSDGSGAYSGDVPGAMNTYFKYSPDAQHSSKHNYSDEEWHSMLMEDLQARRPVYYSGYGADGGHAFVCDGYNSDEYFHFNFGWGGSGNGYFLTESTDDEPEAAGGYSFGQSAIFNLHPLEYSYPSYCQEQTITAIDGTLEDGSGPYPYLDRTSCTYLITHPDQYSVNITLQDMDTQEGHDFLRFWNGHPSRDSLLLEISGNTTGSYSFNSDSLYITFETDDSITAQGWRLSYSSLREGFSCGNHATHDYEGEINDNNPDGNYRDNSSCVWSIRLDNCDYITFTFEEMDISPEDHLDFYDLSHSMEHIAQYTGNTLPEPLVCYTSKVRVRFISDNYLNGSGFVVRWAGSGVGVEEWDTPTALYPNPASETLHLLLPDGYDHCAVTIYNMVGGVVFTQTYDVAGAVDIPVQGLANGVYLLHAESGGKALHKKIVVRH